MMFYLLALSVALAASVLVTPYLPTSDGPQNILSVFMENHYGDPGAIYSHYLGHLPQFAYRGFAVIMGPLERNFGWQIGLQITLIIILLLNAWGFVALVTAINPKRMAIGYLGFPIAWSWSLYMGFFSFMVGTGFGYWIVAYVLTRKNWNLLRWVTLSFMLLAQGFCHVFAALLTAGVVSLLLLEQRQKIFKIAFMLFPLGLIVLGTLIDAWGPYSVQFKNEMFFEPFSSLIRTLPKMWFPGPWPHTIAWLFLLGIILAASIYRLRKKELNRTETIFFWVGISCLLASLILPRDLVGWQFFSPRFIMTGLTSCFILFPLERLQRQRLVTFLLFAGSLFSIQDMALTNLKIGSACGDLVRSLDTPSIKTPGFVVHVFLEQYCETGSESGLDVPYLDPEHHSSALLAMKGNLIPKAIFANSWAAHAFQQIAPPAVEGAPYDGIRQRDLGPQYAPSAIAYLGKRSFIAQAATMGMVYGVREMIVTGAKSEDIRQLEKMGFVEENRFHTLWLSHFEPCKIIIEPKLNLTNDKVPQIDIVIDGLDKALLIGLKGKRLNEKQLEYSYSPCNSAFVEGPPELKGKLKIVDPLDRKIPNSVQFRTRL